MTSEIVNRLRKNSECLAPSIMIAAANQIERQNEIIATLRQQIATLTAERDEARRECCRHMAHGVISETGVAKYLKWDCFKEDGK
jgi:hypothetical protein